MAARSDDDDDIRVSCPVCSELFRQPQSLRCGHVICLSCAHALLERNNFRQFPCAICRQTSTPDDLRPDFTMKDNVERYCTKHGLQQPEATPVQAPAPRGGGGAMEEAFFGASSAPLVMPAVGASSPTAFGQGGPVATSGEPHYRASRSHRYQYLEQEFVWLL